MTTAGPPPPAAASSFGDPRDPTEGIRRLMIETGQPQADLLAAEESWDTAEATGLFEFLGFAAPFVLVRRRANGVRGTLEFTHQPRRYFNFVPEEG